MKVIILAVSFAAFTIVSSFSTTAFAGRRSDQMSGADHTYKSTGKCTGGACALKTPNAPKTRKKK
jgi:hypothetical protein